MPEHKNLEVEMLIVWAIIAIYGLGVMFSFSIFLCAFAGVIADKSSSKESAYLSKRLPLGAIIASGYCLIWPVMLMRDKIFREIVIECSRLAIPFGYLACVFSTFQYPMIWVWFIAFFASWFMLNRYHERQASAQPRE